MLLSLISSENLNIYFFKSHKWLSVNWLITVSVW